MELARRPRGRVGKPAGHGMAVERSGVPWSRVAVSGPDRGIRDRPCLCRAPEEVILQVVVGTAASVQWPVGTARPTAGTGQAGETRRGDGPGREGRRGGVRSRGVRSNQWCHGRRPGSVTVTVSGKETIVVLGRGLSAAASAARGGHSGADCRGQSGTGCGDQSPSATAAGACAGSGRAGTPQFPWTRGCELDDHAADQQHSGRRGQAQRGAGRRAEEDPLGVLLNNPLAPRQQACSVDVFRRDGRASPGTRRRGGATVAPTAPRQKNRCRPSVLAVSRAKRTRRRRRRRAGGQQRVCGGPLDEPLPDPAHRRRTRRGVDEARGDHRVVICRQRALDQPHEDLGVRRCWNRARGEGGGFVIAVVVGVDVDDDGRPRCRARLRTSAVCSMQRFPRTRCAGPRRRNARTTLSGKLAEVGDLSKTAR